MSEVEQYYEAARKKWPNPTRPWSKLNGQEQMMVVQSINLLLGVLNVQP